MPFQIFFEGCEYNNEDGDYDNMDNNYYHGRHYYLHFSCVCWVVTNIITTLVLSED